MSKIARKSYPSDVSDEEWALVAPYLALDPREHARSGSTLRALQRDALDRSAPERGGA